MLKVPTEVYSYQNQAAELGATTHSLRDDTFLPLDAHSLDILPHSSQDQVAQSWATFDLEEPYYLIKEDGAPNTE